MITCSEEQHKNSAKQHRTLWRYISALCASIILKFGNVVGNTVLIWFLKFQISTCIKHNVAYVITKRFSAFLRVCCFISWATPNVNSVTFFRQNLSVVQELCNNYFIRMSICIPSWCSWGCWHSCCRWSGWWGQLSGYSRRGPCAGCVSQAAVAVNSGHSDLFWCLWFCGRKQMSI